MAKSRFFLISSMLIICAYIFGVYADGKWMSVLMNCKKQLDSIYLFSYQVTIFLKSCIWFV